MITNSVVRCPAAPQNGLLHCPDNTPAGLCDLFKVGIGPSSSHTIGPMKAAGLFLHNLSQHVTRTHRVVATAYGSLAWTGKGHATDKALILGLAGERPEEIDCGGRVVTAPTNGAAGVIRRNASISGAEIGCQGEVGSAAAMSAAGLAAALGGSNAQVENAAEIALEHHLGMTCDPIGGLVDWP